MYKIEFFKNNNLIEVDGNKISYIKEKLTIKKENEDNIIYLDFKNKTCNIYLRNEKIEFAIPVEIMNYEITENIDIFRYTLTSEPEAENIIIISKIKDENVY